MGIERRVQDIVAMLTIENLEAQTRKRSSGERPELFYFEPAPNKLTKINNCLPALFFHFNRE